MKKLSTILEVRAACHRNGLAFGAGDNEFQYLSDGNACCASVDLIAGFNSTYRFTVPYIVKQQIMRGTEIRFVDDDLWRPNAPISRYLNSRSRLDSKHSFEKRKVEYFLKHKWNDHNGFNSPARLYGICFTGEKDRSGMNIYVADRDVSILTKENWPLQPHSIFEG